ncbi:MAG: hydrophobe/amphiphile efflux-1 family RND transporter [Rhodospirillaceae bacterium]|nr:hydrophobe/amphiphile efflux-1 family RND transporter [Rhodospirillaceae bacterium]
MRFTHFFVDHPIFASVVSILITLLGAIAYLSLPVAQYPEIAPPTVQVTATYPGASAETVAATVATPLEQEINGVEGMLYAKSEATGDGILNLQVTFELGTDLDDAQVQVQNRVAIATARLPEEVRRLGVTVKKSSPDLMMVIHLLSPDGSRNQLYISNYARTQILDRLSRIPGVGEARVFGERAYSMRIWLDPERVASYGLTAGEVVAALRANNVQVASGILNRAPMENPSAFELNVETQGRLITEKAFEDIVVKRGDGTGVVRVSDVARVELGAQDYQTTAYLDRTTALPIVIMQRPGSNALETAEQVIATMDELAKDFPEGLAHTIVYNPTEFIARSVEAVYTTIAEAVFLVVLVILVFLQNMRAAIVPIIAIPVSLIGTFLVMGTFGYSINNLTLFGLVLAIGIVVDDAIVVVENVERYLARGLTAREAAHKTMDEVGGALIAISLVLVAVFLPTAFIEGISGQFYRQFAVTVATTTVISLIVSLTLSPALCALLLKANHGGHERTGIMRFIMMPTDKFSAGFNWAFERLNIAYSEGTKRLVRMTAMVLVVYGGLLGLTAYEFKTTPTGFIPEQDQGYLITVVQLPAGSSLARTDEVVRRAIDIILKHPDVEHAVGFAGFDAATFTNAPNGGAIFVPMKPIAERDARGSTVQKVLGELQGQLFQIEDAMIFLVAPPPVRGIGRGGGWKLYVQDRRGRGIEALQGAAQALVAAANQEPGLTRVFSLFNSATPKIYADIDRVKAEMLNVPVERVLDTLEVYIGSAYVNDFNFLGRTFRVTAQADGPYRNEPGDVAKLKTRSENGDMVPIGSIATFHDITGPHRMPRYNLYPAAEVQGAKLPSISTGESLAKVEALADKVLPDGFSYEWTEIALQQKLAGDTAMFAFGLAVIFVFLLLAALYESWALPLAVILIVPMCLLASILGLNMRGMDSNILAQVGFVVLIALAAKNAILIVEFAKQAEDEKGMHYIDAAVEAARTRLRPILMTSFAFILGVLPLMIAEGAGAEMRQALGTTVFSGMVGVTFFGLIFTPTFYVVCRWMSEKLRALFGRGETAA